ncbi:MAG: DNA mismatch repair endonuclease MutL [Synergistaceae bacterium]|jgi:DNA mismatch repair protein MutL|nr:DNA mismatch repair endonuclease MutL [Synergistaceae bacterium]
MTNPSLIGSAATAVRIKRLEESVASRIAAGEVIERPVSAAKELLENSIDAGASDIRITLEQGGRASLVVEDDGDGIAFEDLPLAVERHATSKIRDLEDLERVLTLGYRGEALSSVAAVSRLELRSRRRGEDSGGALRSEGGVILSCSRVPCREGTRVQVGDLFYNLPARRKFMKSSSSELKRIIQIVQDYAIANPKIRFRVANDGKDMLDLGDASGTEEVLDAIWGDERRSVHAEAAGDGISVSIWWNGLPGSRRVSVTAFVNRRRVQDPTIRAALNATDASIYGEWVVMLEVPPEEVDVNIHPAKAEVRFRQTGPIFELVRRGAQKALLAGGGFSVPGSGDGDAACAPARPLDPWENYSPQSRLFEDRGKMPEMISNFPPQTEAGGAREKGLFEDSSPGESRKYLGQAQGGYLVFDDPRGLCLIDAHAAHERILYEQIEDAYSGRGISSQALLMPQELPPAVAASAAIHRDELASMGFSFRFPSGEGEGSSVPELASVPALRGLGRMSPLELLRSAIRGIEEEPDPSKRDREVWWRWARTACRDAIKLGETLDREEAVGLFERLERCRSPYSCPHGRPTTIFLAGEKLKRWFER